MRTSALVDIVVARHDGAGGDSERAEGRGGAAEPTRMGRGSMRVLKWVLIATVLLLVVLPVIGGLILWLWSGIVGG